MTGWRWDLNTVLEQPTELLRRITELSALSNLLRSQLQENKKEGRDG